MKILFCFLVAIVLSVVDATTTLVVKQNYHDKHDGWFHVSIHNGAHVDRIMWCSTLFAPRVGQVPRDIRDCHADALLHVEIYPAMSDDMYAFESNGVIRINPASVGGFWLDRPANLVIHGTYPDGKRLEQIVRLNPTEAYVNDEGEEERKDVVRTTRVIAASLHTTEPQKGPAKAVPLIVEEEQQQQQQQGTIPTQTSQDATFGLFAVIALVGAAGMVLTVALAFVRRQTVREMVNQAKPTKLELPYDAEVMYEFEDELGIKEREEAKRQQAENLKILTQMGKGANPSFFANM